MTPDWDYRTEPLTLARTYCEAAGLGMARVATLVHDNGAFFKRLESGGGRTVDTYVKVKAWFARQWPGALAWPDGIDRPDVKAAA